MFPYVSSLRSFLFTLICLFYSFSLPLFVCFFIFRVSSPKYRFHYYSVFLCCLSCISLSFCCLLSCLICRFFSSGLTSILYFHSRDVLLSLLLPFFISPLHQPSFFPVVFLYSSLKSRVFLMDFIIVVCPLIDFSRHCIALEYCVTDFQLPVLLTCYPQQCHFFSIHQYEK